MNYVDVNLLLGNRGIRTIIFRNANNDAYAYTQMKFDCLKSAQFLCVKPKTKERKLILTLYLFLQANRIERPKIVKVI